jgi:hypothetical protein
VVTRIFAEAQARGREARMRGLRDLDAAALTLRRGWGLLLEQDESGDPRGAVFAALPRAAIEAAMARVDALVRPPDDPCFDELLAQHRRVRRFLPDLARAARLGATPAARPLLVAAPARGGPRREAAQAAARRVRAPGLAGARGPRRRGGPEGLDAVPG